MAEVSGLFKNTYGAKVARGEQPKQTNIRNIRAEAIKEFVERLKERAYLSSDWSHGEHPYVVEADDIDGLVDEMVGADDA